MKNKYLYLTIAIIVFSFSLTQSQSIKDIDGTEYKTVKINNQTWMAENLNVTHFLNGDSIPQVKTEVEWIKAGKEGKPAWCYYNNDTINGRKYGKLYNWYAVNDPRGIAPKGWHVPMNNDWTSMAGYLGFISIVGSKLKNNSGWEQNGKITGGSVTTPVAGMGGSSANGNGNNKSGYSAIPGGCRTVDGIYKDIGYIGQWWSTSGEVGLGKQVYSILLNSGDAISYIKIDKENGLSIRCIKD